jgi:hypothetical protein
MKEEGNATIGNGGGVRQAKHFLKANSKKRLVGSVVYPDAGA